MTKFDDAHKSFKWNLWNQKNPKLLPAKGGWTVQRAKYDLLYYVDYRVYYYPYGLHQFTILGKKPERHLIEGSESFHHNELDQMKPQDVAMMVKANASARAERIETNRRKYDDYLRK